jgi:hypothetical protein
MLAGYVRIAKTAQELVLRTIDVFTLGGDHRLPGYRTAERLPVQ